MESHECWGHWYRTKKAWAKERSVKVLTFLMALYDYLLELKAHWSNKYYFRYIINGYNM